ncbi:MAG TPA: ABC transporter ATP-binding protein [Candidatus Aquilonibacter sp.]
MMAGSTDVARSAELLRATGLSKEYVTQKGPSILAVDDVTLTLGDGEFVSVVGPSGCGKTTLLKMFSGVVTPSRGEIMHRGTRVRGPRAGTGVVFQSPVLFPWLSVFDNVMLPVKILRLARGAYEARARELLTLVGLARFAEKYPHELSGGMQQRVAIARGLIHNPDLLLMDEPFAALDALSRERLNLELQRIWLDQRKTVFFITHSIPEAVLLSDRVIVMSRRPGRLIAEFDVPFARPRDLDVMSTIPFGKISAQLRHLLQQDDDA